MRYKKSTTSYELQPRTDLTTIGAYDFNPNPPQVIGISLSPASATVLIGFSETPTVTCAYDDGSFSSCPYAASAYTWSVSSGGGLSVTSAGLVTGTGVGSASVTATVNGMSGSQAVTVNPLIPKYSGNIHLSGRGVF